MLTIGPFAAISDQGIQWLQITISDSGVCTECKQASATDFISNTWKTLEPGQWPTILSAYDPSLSQRYFMLSRDSDNKLSRHLFTQYTPPKTNDEQDQAPIDRVTSQTYLGNQLGPITIVQNPTKKTGLLAAKRQPDENQEAAIKTQYHQWERGQLINWHQDTAHPDLSMPNSPLDFRTTQKGAAKPSIETNLAPNQQWLVQSIIQERVAVLKEESATSEEYRNALHFLIDGTAPSASFSTATQKNIDDVKAMISYPGIDHYMKPNFYTKLTEKNNKNSKRVPMIESDPGFDVAIVDVKTYIQQLLLAEIQQYFPDYSPTITEHPISLGSNCKIGTLPREIALEESTTGLNPQEIRQIDSLYRLYTRTDSLILANEETITELYELINSVKNRLAATESVASTFRLMLPNSTDFQYENALNDMAKRIQKIRQLKQLFLELSTSDTHNILSAYDNVDIHQLMHNLLNKPTWETIRSLPPSDRVGFSIRLFQEKIINGSDLKLVAQNLATKDPNIKNTLVNTFADTFTPLESERFKQLFAVLTGNLNINFDTQESVVQDLAQMVNLIGPRTAAQSQFLEFIDALGYQSLSLIEGKIEGYNLYKHINEILNRSGSEDKSEELVTLIPFIYWKNEQTIMPAIKNLTIERQIVLLRAALKYPLNNSKEAIESLIRETFGELKSTIIEQELQDLSSIEQSYFTTLNNPLLNETTIENLSKKDMLLLQTALNATFPNNTRERSKIAGLLNISLPKSSTLKNLQRSINGRLLAKDITEYFSEPKNTHSQARLNKLLPLVSKTENLSSLYQAANVLNATLPVLTAEQQTEVLKTLFNQQQMSRDVAKELFGDSSPLKFNVMFEVMMSLSPQQMTILIGHQNALYVLRTLLSKYNEDNSREPREFLREISEETLDKLMPKINDKNLQIYLDDYHMQLTELPKADTTNWKNTAENIASLFAQTKTSIAFINQLRSATTPKQVKELLLLEVTTGYFYNAEYMVAIAMKRLSEHESAIEQSISSEIRGYHIQLRSGGELGKHLALELECLLGNKQGTNKLMNLKEALDQLPEKVSEAELHEQLSDRNSALNAALFAPVAPAPARGLTFFSQSKPAEPDMAFLKEINLRLKHLDKSLGASDVQQTSPGRR